jgi:protein gp37
MADVTGIQWTDATFNPWWGCERVSPACAHCYADTVAHRYGHDLWGAETSRRFFGDEHWRQPLRWDRKAEASGTRTRVFCASMADVFEDRDELEKWRVRLWGLIEATPNLDWQLLTKRPENVAAMVPWEDDWPANVWIGASIENSRFTFRADVLRELPAAVRFISAEPLLGSLMLNGKPNRRPLELEGISWVIVGGESGPRARPMRLEDAQELVDACRAGGVAPFVKQLGSVLGKSYGGGKGGDIEAFPAPLQVREFPG